MRILFLFEMSEDVAGAKEVESRDGVALMVAVAHHCESFAGACLAIGEASDFSLVESSIDHGGNDFFVDLVISGVFIVGFIEVEPVLFYILC